MNGDRADDRCKFERRVDRRFAGRVEGVSHRTVEAERLCHAVAVKRPPCSVQNHGAHGGNVVAGEVFLEPRAVAKERSGKA